MTKGKVKRTENEIIAAVISYLLRSFLGSFLKAEGHKKKSLL